MAYFLIDKNNIVIQKQPYMEEGFIEGPDYVTCGYMLNKDGTYSIPELQKEETKEEVSNTE